MGRGGAVYLTYTALVLLAGAPSARAEIKGLWKVDIDESPAPPPDKGPPLSAHAIRDRGVLPYEIVGIIAAYIVFVLCLGTMLLTVGRKLRKRAQEMASGAREMDNLPSVPRVEEVKGSKVIVQSNPLDSDEHRKAHEEHKKRMYDAQAQNWDAVHGPEENDDDDDDGHGVKVPGHHVRALSYGSNKTDNSRKSRRKPMLTITRREYRNHDDGEVEPLSPSYEPGTARTYNSQPFPTPATMQSFGPADEDYEGFEEDRFNTKYSAPLPSSQYRTMDQAQNYPSTGPVSNRRAPANNSVTTELPLRRIDAEERKLYDGLNYYGEGVIPLTPNITTQMAHRREGQEETKSVLKSPYWPCSPQVQLTTIPDRERIKELQEQERMMEGNMVANEQDRWQDIY